MNQYALYAIYDTLHVPFWQKTNFFYGLFLVPFLLIVLLGFFYFKRRVALVSPWKKALRQLSLVKNRVVESDQDHKNRYYLLSSIIKTYFYDRYAIDILSATDGECAEILHGRSVLSVELLDRLQAFFLVSTLIKFSEVPINQEQLLVDIATLVDVVSATTPKNPELNRKQRVNE